MLLTLLAVLVLLFLWTSGFLFATDFSLPTKKTKHFKHVLVIFPHADDEAVNCGGTLHRLSKTGSTVTLVILTKGERGTPDATLDEHLKAIRTKEAQSVAALLGISHLQQEDFGDGTLHMQQQALQTFIENLIAQEKPDLLITYDLAGFYGHPDHIACSQIITTLQKTTFQQISLWYATFPKRLLATVKLPEHLLRDPLFQTKRAAPTHKIFIGSSVFPKIQAWYTYKSQRASLTTGIGKLLPLWFFLSMVLFEYFANVDNSSTSAE